MICISLFRPEFPSIPKQKIIRSIAESDAVPRILFEEKEQECLAKDETIRVNKILFCSWESLLLKSEEEKNVFCLWESLLLKI
jgi:hypothetical protein